MTKPAKRRVGRRGVGGHRAEHARAAGFRMAAATKYGIKAIRRAKTCSAAVVEHGQVAFLLGEVEREVAWGRRLGTKRRPAAKVPLGVARRMNLITKIVLEKCGRV